MRPEVFDSRNVDEIEAYFSMVWGSMRLGNVAGDVRARISRRVHNTIRFDNRGEADTFGPGEQFLVARPGLPYTGVALSTRLRLTVVDPALLDRVAGVADGAAPPVRLLDHRPVSRQAQQRLQHTITHLRDIVATCDDLTAPLVAGSASQYLAATVLQTYPSTAIAEPTVQDRHDAHPDTLRRAIAFVEANPHCDISIVDIAAASFVTVRAVQLAFRRHLGTTPMAYLRRVRLDRAHHDLAAADPERVTVTGVAMRWGFVNTSRFAGHYRAAYGVLPSHTLRERH